MGRNIGGAGKLVQAVVRRRLHLVEVVIAVVALILRVVRQRQSGAQVVASARQGVAEEWIGRILAWTVHIGHTGGSEALSPIIPATGFGGINQSQGLGPVRARAFGIEIDGYARNQRLPEVLEQLIRIIKRPGRAVYDMAADAADLVRDIGFLAPLDDVKLADTALPPFADD